MSDLNFSQRFYNRMCLLKPYVLKLRQILYTDAAPETEYAKKEEGDAPDIQIGEENARVSGKKYSQTSGNTYFPKLSRQNLHRFLCLENKRFVFCGLFFGVPFLILTALGIAYETQQHGCWNAWWTRFGCGLHGSGCVTGLDYWQEVHCVDGCDLRWPWAFGGEAVAVTVDDSVVVDSSDDSNDGVSSNDEDSNNGNSPNSPKNSVRRSLRYLYSANSAICSAGTHAGIVSASRGGCLRFRVPKGSARDHFGAYLNPTNKMVTRHMGYFPMTLEVEKCLVSSSSSAGETFSAVAIVLRRISLIFVLLFLLLLGMFEESSLKFFLVTAGTGCYQQFLFVQKSKNMSRRLMMFPHTVLLVLAFMLCFFKLFHQYHVLNRGVWFSKNPKNPKKKSRETSEMEALQKPYKHRNSNGENFQLPDITSRFFFIVAFLFMTNFFEELSGYLPALSLSYELFYYIQDGPDPDSSHGYLSPETQYAVLLTMVFLFLALLVGVLRDLWRHYRYELFGGKKFCGKWCLCGNQCCGIRNKYAVDGDSGAIDESEAKKEALEEGKHRSTSSSEEEPKIAAPPPATTRFSVEKQKISPKPSRFLIIASYLVIFLVHMCLLLIANRDPPESEFPIPRNIVTGNSAASSETELHMRDKLQTAVHSASTYTTHFHHASCGVLMQLVAVAPGLATSIWLGVGAGFLVEGISMWGWEPNFEGLIRGHLEVLSINGANRRKESQMSTDDQDIDNVRKLQLGTKEDVSNGANLIFLDNDINDITTQRRMLEQSDNDNPTTQSSAKVSWSSSWSSVRKTARPVIDTYHFKRNAEISDCFFRKFFHEAFLDLKALLVSEVSEKSLLENGPVSVHGEIVVVPYEKTNITDKTHAFMYPVTNTIEVLLHHYVDETTGEQTRTIRRASSYSEASSNAGLLNADSQQCASSDHFMKDHVVIPAYEYVRSIKTKSPPITDRVSLQNQKHFFRKLAQDYLERNLILVNTTSTRTLKHDEQQIATHVKIVGGVSTSSSASPGLHTSAESETADLHGPDFAIESVNTDPQDITPNPALKDEAQRFFEEYWQERITTERLPNFAETTYSVAGGSSSGFYQELVDSGVARMMKEIEGLEGSHLEGVVGGFSNVFPFGDFFSYEFDWLFDLEPVFGNYEVAGVFYRDLERKLGEMKEKMNLKEKQSSVKTNSTNSTINSINTDSSILTKLYNPKGVSNGASDFDVDFQKKPGRFSNALPNVETPTEYSPSTEAYVLLYDEIWLVINDIPRHVVDINQHLNHYQIPENPIVKNSPVVIEQLLEEKQLTPEQAVEEDRYHLRVRLPMGNGFLTPGHPHFANVMYKKGWSGGGGRVYSQQSGFKHFWPGETVTGVLERDETGVSNTEL